MNAPEDALAETVIAWACQPTIGPTTYHDTEAAAESLARSLVGSAPGLRGVRRVPGQDRGERVKVRKRRCGGHVRAVGASRAQEYPWAFGTLVGRETANLGGRA